MSAPKKVGKLNIGGHVSANDETQVKKRKPAKSVKSKSKPEDKGVKIDGKKKAKTKVK